ncbi:hypothetical protein ACS8E2_05615 [Psychrobacter glaciei]|uniref:hypothetical protein n=1 Tax=Psychrobacter glaciei TaxID=619771 RepID=UPI003F45CDE4
MAVNKIFKIPRDVLAKITGGNPQAIKAFENIEATSNGLPQDMADLAIQIEGAASQAEQAAILATQAVAIINQMIADNQAPLQAVSVPSESQTYLQAVSVSLDCQNQLIPVQGDI